MVPGTAPACFFRSAAADGRRKALVQITERCNLHCAHCFVSATRQGSDLALNDFTELLLPRLREAEVDRLTLTGGEPFAHPHLVEAASAAVESGFKVGICTNATLVEDESVDRLAEVGGVHVNVSLDGFSRESHGRFRGSPDSFDTTVATVRRLAEKGLLQGLLSTPHSRTNPDEYRALGEFASEVGATYLLINPLSTFGRGVQSARTLSVSHTQLAAVHMAAGAGAGGVEVVPVRLGNPDRLPLGGCVAGSIIYVFVNGEVAFCPYLAFAAKTPASRDGYDRFIAGNILAESVHEPLDRFDPEIDLAIGSDPACDGCELGASCGRGCPAASIAAGARLGTRDIALCAR